MCQNSALIGRLTKQSPLMILFFFLALREFLISARLDFLALQKGLEGQTKTSINTEDRIQ